MCFVVVGITHSGGSLDASGTSLTKGLASSGAAGTGQESQSHETEANTGGVGNGEEGSGDKSLTHHVSVCILIAKKVIDIMHPKYIACMAFNTVTCS